MKIKTCKNCGNEKLTSERRAELMTCFEETHGMGAEAFHLAWLNANNHATQAARALHLDPSDPRMRALLSQVCFRILSAIFLRKETKTK